MNGAKRVNIDYSSLVGLKTELLRKQIEVEKAKVENELKNSTFPSPRLKTKSESHKNGKSTKKERKKSEFTDIEDDNNDLKKSRHMLELKSQLYEKLKKNSNDNETEHYLVDFTDKSNSFSLADDDSNSNNKQDDWVEYEDCFGRTRKCLRKDLSKLQAEDIMIKESMKSNSSEKVGLDLKSPKELLNPVIVEPEIEKLRKKWEEQSEKLSHKQDIHYQDILFDEARMHGVGYYEFSSNEEERIKQQKRFMDIRKETEQRQKEKQNIKDLKVKIEKNRLKAARIRQRIRAGLPPPENDEEEETSTSNSTEKVEGTLQPESLNNPDESAIINNKKNDNVAIIEDKIKAFGELLGKRPKFRELSQEEWVDKKRKHRLEEFAPIYDNFCPSRALEGNLSNSIVQTDAEKDPLRIGGEGPEPTDIWDNRDVSSEECIKTENEITKNKDTDEIPTTHHINVEKIAEGLKYLREQYDQSVMNSE